MLHRLEQVDNREAYVYNGKYWDMRRDPGFASVSLPRLWWPTARLVRDIVYTGAVLNNHRQ